MTSGTSIKKCVKIYIMINSNFPFVELICLGLITGLGSRSTCQSGVSPVVHDVTQQCVLVQTWLSCKLPNIKQPSTAAVLQKHLIKKVRKIGKCFNISDVSSKEIHVGIATIYFFCFLVFQCLVTSLFFHLPCLSNIRCLWCLTSSISGPAESYFLNKQKLSLKYAEKHKSFSLQELSERKTGNCSCLSFVLFYLCVCFLACFTNGMKSS